MLITPREGIGAPISQMRLISRCANSEATRSRIKECALFVRVRVRNGNGV